MSRRRGGQSRSRRKAAGLLDTALENVRRGKTPDVSDCDAFGIIAIIDPFEEGVVAQERRDDPGYGGERLKVVALRDDPIGRMHRRKQLRRDNEEDDSNADLRLKAARRWQALYEAAEIGGARGIDPAKDAVDGGILSLPDTDRRLTAQVELGKLDRVLGIVGANLVRRVLGEKRELGEVAAMLGERSKRAGSVLGRRLIECLDTLAIQMGYVTKRPARGPRRDPDRFDEIAARYSSRTYGATRRREDEG